MTSMWRRQLLEQHADETERWFTELAEVEPLGDEDFETQRRTNWLETVRQYDPSASLGEELAVRLTGSAAATGALRFDVGNALLKPLQDGITAVNEKLALELVGVSSGSTVLHVLPKLPVPPSEPDHDFPPVDSSPADKAVADLVGLVAAAEAHQDVRRWLNMLDSLYSLVAALDKFGLDMALDWYTRRGPVRSSVLTETGRSYVRELSTVDSEAATTIVAGRVTELRSSGVVKVKTAPQKNSRSYEVKIDPDQLMSMHLELGVTVTLEVWQDRKLDKTGRDRGTEYTFVRLIEHSPLFEEGPPIS